MNHTKSARLHRLALGFLSCIFALHAQAACTFFDAFQDNKDGTVTDPRNGVIWKRCAEGLNWDGAACNGSINEVTWFEAMNSAKKSRFQNQGGWRLPTRIEMEQVLGKHPDCSNNDYKKGEYAANRMIALAAGQDNRPGRFWSSSSHVSYADGAWVVYFQDGYGSSLYRDSSANVRLVRASQSAGGTPALEFEREHAQRVEPKFTQNEKQLMEALGYLNFSEVESALKKMKEIDYPAVSWKVSANLPNDSGNLYSSKIRDSSEHVFAALAGLVKADQKLQLITLPNEPSAPRDLPSRKSPLVKGEFESTAQFAVRQSEVAATAQAALTRDQRAFEAARRDYEAALKQQADAQARALADSNDPEKNKALIAKHLPQAVALALGNPVLSDISYDADKQVFNAILKSSRGAFSQAVTVAASLADAPKLKQDLLSQKIAPVVTLQLPSLAATWALQENTALRAERFAQANNSPRRLLELIAEYPASAEASAARQRIPVAQREAYAAAVRSNSSSAYQSFISDFSGTDTQRLLPQAEAAKLAAAQREARERQAKEAQERRDEAERAEQYRRDAPAREERARGQQVCEAQRQTCLASCGNASYWNGKNYVENQSWSNCRSQCNRINCN